MSNENSRLSPPQAAEVPLSPSAPATVFPEAQPSASASASASAVSSPPASLLPLALMDERFAILRVNTLKEMRKRFLKLFKRTANSDQRVLPDEMAIFISLLAFEELKQIDLALLEQPAAIRAQHDPFIIFTQVFSQFVDQYRKMVAPQQSAKPLSLSPSAMTLPENIDGSMPSIASSSEGAAQAD